MDTCTDDDLAELLEQLDRDTYELNLRRTLDALERGEPTEVEYLVAAVECGLLLTEPEPLEVPTLVESVADAAGVDEVEVLWALVDAVAALPSQEEIAIAEREAEKSTPPPPKLPAADGLGQRRGGNVLSF